MWLPPPLPRTLEACLRDAKSEKPKVRASALADLVRHGREEAHRAQAVSVATRALEDDDAIVRAAAAVALADLGASESIAPLLTHVEDDDPHVREMALVALGEIGDRRALPRLRRALGDTRPEVRYQAVIAFARVEKDDDEDAARALVRASEDEDMNVRYVALRSAEERFADAQPEPVRAAAARRLDDPEPDVANAAAILLARGGDARGERRVLAIVRGDQRATKEDERGAIEVAGDRAYEAARAPLQKRAWGLGRVLRDTCAWHAKVALARMGDERAVAEIVRDLVSTDKDARQAAVVAVGRARIATARAAVEAARDVDEDLRREALRALTLTTGRGA